ncbi:MAG: hypothetical protein Q8Q07_04480, partial [Dehalococcoidales bacterium]|nr:hypothetical protein [Dehalococcoidales bacterium]
MAKSRTRTLALALTFLLGLIGAISAPGPANALPDEAKWSRVNIPGEGESGQWALASDSNVQHLTMAADGTLYSYANPSGTSYRLFRSTDAGATWTATGKVKDTISDIATAPDDAAVIYYATASSVHKSVDAGANFTLLPLSPGGAGSDNIEITSIAVTLQGNNNLVAVGTRDTDAAQYGGVHILDEASPFSGWVNTNAGNIDVYRVAFSPEFTTDRQLLAVATDETDTFIISRISDNDWGTIIGDARIEALTPVAATIAFPDNYDIASEDSVFFVAIDSASNNGDVYKVYGMWAPDSSTAIDLNIGAAYNLDSIDISGLAVSGSAPTASLLAGAAGSTQVYISTDGGTTWTRSRQKPTGQSQTRIIMAPDFTASGTIYAATSGTESAFSYSTDGGVTWKQASLIDTKISDNGIIDLAVSPDYSRDSALFMLTFNGEHIEHSLWRSLSGGAKWERLLTGTLADADSLSHVRLSPQYGSQSQNVFLAGSSGGTPAIWKS